MAQFNGSATNIENNENKVQAITNESTETQYPSAKAVFDFVSENCGGGSDYGVIKIWQPKTQYNVDDFCYGGYTNKNTNLTESCFFKCISAHVSGDWINDDISKWQIMHITAYSAYTDIFQNSINATYATKDELAEAIGEALRGDY